MRKLASAIPLASALLTVSTAALAHRDGTYHSHPHLIISNEFLAALCLLAGAGLVFATRRLLKARRNQNLDRSPR